MRDIMKRAEEGRAIIREHRKNDLSLSEILFLYQMAHSEEDSAADALLNVINTAFDLGVSVGSRIEKKH